jgi:hypothetical protein
MLSALPEAEPRLQRRYHRLIVSQLSSAQRLAAGVHAPPALARGFATTQAAWRFFSNPRITLPQLCRPLVAHACEAVPGCCQRWVPVVLDWSNLHFNGHESKTDRIELSSGRDLGYEMLTALALSDRDGSPIAPLCIQVRAADGLHTTRSAKVLAADSQLDGLLPVMREVQSQPLGRPVVFIIDREADSVAHYRRWDSDGKRFVVRANDARWVRYQGKELRLEEVAQELAGSMQESRGVSYKGKPAKQFISQTTVVLDRPAYTHRVVGSGKNRGKKHKVIPGPAITLRLIVAEVRDDNGKRLARWLLLSNLPEVDQDGVDVPGATIALWYYWRWKIESYHKLLKSAGHHVEQWLQESAPALTRRLLLMAMVCVLVWHIARDQSPEGAQLRQTLVRLSGRQVKQGSRSSKPNDSILLAGLCVAIPMMILLETMSMEELKAMAHDVMPLIRSATHSQRNEAG